MSLNMRDAWTRQNCGPFASRACRRWPITPARLRFLIPATQAKLYGVLLGNMQQGRMLGESGRYARLAPVIDRTFDIP